MRGDDLNERDNEIAGDWPPQERKIQTQPYDLSLNTLLEQWNDKTLLIPEFQRELVWDNSKSSRLIESLLLNIPIPVLYFAETVDAQYEVVDGHQRVSSIVRYMNNEYALHGLRIQDEFKNLRFNELPIREQRFLKSRTMRVIIITADSHPDMKFEVFERLNTGSVALNAQEIRRAVYRGNATELLDNLVQHSSFRYTIGRTKPRPRFVDQELILRFFAMRTRIRQYRPPLLRFLNEFLRDANSGLVPGIREIRTDFERTCDLVAEVFGDSAFRLLDSNGRAIEGNLNRALFESQMLTLAAAESSKVRANSKIVIEIMADLCQDSVFLDAIQRATGDRTKTVLRVIAFADQLDLAGISIDYASLGLPRQT